MKINCWGNLVSCNCCCMFLSCVWLSLDMLSCYFLISFCFLCLPVCVYLSLLCCFFCSFPFFVYLVAFTWVSLVSRCHMLVIYIYFFPSLSTWLSLPLRGFTCCSAGSRIMRNVYISSCVPIMRTGVALGKLTEV